jgi:hypothetical protein
MAKSIGIVLAAGTISGGNEWWQTKQVPWRIGIATLAAALLMDGLEKLNEPLAVGTSVAILVTALFTPFKGTSPAVEMEKIFNKG